MNFPCYCYLVLLLLAGLQVVSSEEEEWSTLPGISESKKFRMLKGDYDWYTAQRACEGGDSHLAIMDSDSMWEALKRKGATDSDSCKGDFWVGARDVSMNKNDWKWVTGQSVSQKYWGSNQPENHEEEQGCAVMCRNGDLGVMYYRPCGAKLSRYLCMQDDTSESREARHLSSKDSDGASNGAAIRGGLNYLVVIVILLSSFVLKFVYL